MANTRNAPAQNLNEASILKLVKETLGTTPMIVSVFESQSDINALLPKIEEWGTVATVYEQQGIKADMMANFIIKAMQVYLKTAITIRTNDRKTSAVALSLSPRETEILTLLAKGKPLLIKVGKQKSISEILSISPNTLKDYMKKIRRKLGARNKTHAVYIAICMGIIELQPSEIIHEESTHRGDSGPKS